MVDQDDEDDTPVVFESWCDNCKEHTSHQMINLGAEDKPNMADLCIKCNHIT